MRHLTLFYKSYPFGLFLTFLVDGLGGVWMDCGGNKDFHFFDDGCDNKEVYGYGLRINKRYCFGNVRWGYCFD